MDLGSTPPIAQLTTADMAALARILRSVNVALTGNSFESSAQASYPHECVILARRLKAGRNQRAQFFNVDMFGEPAWDMVLALYIADGEGYRLKISDVCNESGVPATTALRWVDRLIDLGMARKIPNPLDARSTFIEATEALRRQMTEYLQHVLVRLLTPTAKAP